MMDGHFVLNYMFSMCYSVFQKSKHLKEQLQYGMLKESAKV